MNEPVNHHYLPVFYLHQWCGAGGKLVRYYRPRDKVVASPVTPDNTGYEPHLYALEGYPAAQRQWIETSYMAPKVDDPAARALQVLLAHNTPNLSAETRTDWTRFLMSLWLRDPTTLAQTHEEARAGLLGKLAQNPEEYEAAKSADDPATFHEWVETYIPHLLDNVGKIFMPELIDNAEVGTVMMQMRWSAFDLSSSGISLLTSDRPLIRIYGLKDKRCVVVLPISPRMAFIATNALETERGLLRAGTARLAKDINARVVAQAIKHVYGASCGHLRFVENRLAPVGHVPLSAA
jgi:hypothetical protein